MLSIFSLLAIVLSLCGLAAGYALAHFTKEEIKAGKKYFAYSERALLMSVFAVFLSYSAVFSLWTALLVSITAFLVLVYVPSRLIRLCISYFAFVFFLLITAQDQIFFLVEASLIFLYGLFAGSLLDKAYCHFGRLIRFKHTAKGTQ